jgi:hypothetical protein
MNSLIDRHSNRTIVYGEKVQWKAGKTIQLYMDCDNELMAFGFDGIFLGKSPFIFCFFVFVLTKS